MIFIRITHLHDYCYLEVSGHINMIYQVNIIDVLYDLLA